MSSTIYYMDESGSTGDLIPSKFNNQPFFSLGCIGIKDIDKECLENRILDIKRKYNLQTKELKSSNIYPNKNDLFYDIVRFLSDIDAQVMIELVDKKTQILINIVESLVSPTHLLYSEKCMRNNIIQNNFIFVPYLYELLDDSFLEDFAIVCQNPSEDKLLNLFDNIKKLIKGSNEIEDGILKNIEETIDDFSIKKEEERKNSINRPAYTFFLPLPDTNLKGKIIGSLPNITCFTNLYARINLINNQKLCNVKIVHDEQSHFEHLINQYHSDLINQQSGPFVFENANFDFPEKSELVFENSTNNIGIQVADLVCGVCSRFAKDYLEEKTENIKKWKKSIKDIVLQREKCNGLGVNIVMAEHKREEMFRLIES